MPRYAQTAPAEAWAKQNLEKYENWCNLTPAQRTRAWQALSLLRKWLGEHGDGKAERLAIYWEEYQLLAENSKSFSALLHSHFHGDKILNQYKTSLYAARWDVSCDYLGADWKKILSSAWVTNEQEPDIHQLTSWLSQEAKDFHLRLALLKFNLHLKHAKRQWLQPLMYSKLPKIIGNHGVEPLIPNAWIRDELKGMSEKYYEKCLPTAKAYFSPSNRALWEFDMLRHALEVLQEPPEKAHADLKKLAESWELPARLWDKRVTTR